jgi:rhodanese-related sulfurtransferase
LAGATGLGWWSFLLLNGLGTALWAGAAVGAGLVFHAEINQLILGLQDLGTIAIAVLGVLLAAYIALKWWQRRRFFRLLRISRITVDELLRLMAGDPAPVVVDLRSSVSRDQDRRAIPGALWMSVEEVDRHLDRLPVDRDIVFYCSCPNEAAAAYVAKRLIDLGYRRVLPLLGVLDAWVAAGYQVESWRPASTVDGRNDIITRRSVKAMDRWLEITIAFTLPSSSARANGEQRNQETLAASRPAATGWCRRDSPG